MKKGEVWLLGALIVVAGAALFATQAATYQSANFFTGWLVWLVVIDVALIVIMAAGVLFVAARLIIVWRRGRPGARLSLRLSVFFLLMSLLPVSVLYSVSTVGVFRSIESWFDTPLERSFEKGIEFGQDVLGREFARLEDAARDIADDLSARRGSLPFWASDMRLLHGLNNLSLFDRDGILLYSSDPTERARRLPGRILRQVSEEGMFAKVAGGGAVRDIEMIVRLPNPRNVYALQVSRGLPAGIADGLDEIERGHREYEKLLVLRRGLRLSFVLTLTLSLGIILLLVSWISLRLGRQLALPLIDLSEAAAAVGGGDFSRRLSESGNIAEVTRLNRAFNKMGDDLRDLHRQIERRQEELRNANAYMENLLSSLTAGVLTFSPDGRLSGHNAAAESLLQAPLSGRRGEAASSLARLSPLLAAVIEALERRRGEAAGEWLEQRVPADGGRVLLLRAAALSPAAGGGALVIIDDITRQMRAEREATWGEASRRFAHEIKNPLTPVQLAAERLWRKLGDKLDGGDAELLHSLVKTIVNQVGAMRQMINSFRDYADEQRRTLAPLDFRPLLDDVLLLYEGRRIRLRRDLCAGALPINGDGVALRQLLHNLLVNACDALEKQEAPLIALTCERAGGEVRLTIEDNGGGVAEDMLHNICEPYVTTKAHGTGLGLAMVRRTAERHGGALRISNGDAGLRVVLRLPLSPPDMN